MTFNSIDEAQKIILDIYKFIKKICDDNNIKCFAVWGTLLGSIRHNGFIPWDDDMDIGFKFDDYKKFKKIAKKINHQNYEFIWELSNKSTNFDVCRCIDKRYLKKYNGLDAKCHPFVDIFIYIPSSIKYNLRHRIARQLMFLLYFKRRNKLDNNVHKSITLFKNISVPARFIPSFVILRFLYLIFIKLSIKKRSKVFRPVNFNCIEYRFDDEVNNLVITKFEDSWIFVPYAYEKILLRNYGNSWSSPPNDISASYKHFEYDN